MSLPSSKSGKPPLEIAVQAAHIGGKILRENFDRQKQVSKKGKCNLVSDIDCLSEDKIIKFLKQEYPSFNILAEESSNSSPVDGLTWIIDPLDGTNNYIYGVPLFCTTLALVKDDDILLGVTYDPVRDELFSAEKGKGTSLNGKSVNVSAEPALSSAMVGLDLGYDISQASGMIDFVKRLWGNVHCVRLMGSSALGLAYVAAGRISTYLHCSLFPWDIAGGILLIREAGGVVQGWQSEPATYMSKGIVAANSSLVAQVLGYSKLPGS